MTEPSQKIMRAAQQRAEREKSQPKTAQSKVKNAVWMVMVGACFAIGVARGLLAAADTKLVSGSIKVPNISPATCAIEFPVANYGAKPGNEAPCTQAIQKAIDAAAIKGGTVVFAPGIYLTGAIFVKSNVHLRLDEGVVLCAVADDTAYPEMWTRVAGTEMMWPSAFINVCEQSNVRISGKGVIDGHGDFWWEKYWGKDRKSGMMAETKKNPWGWALDFYCKRPRLLQVYKSSNVLLEGFTVKHSPFWTIHLVFSNNLIARGLTVANDGLKGGPSSDGIDVDSSSDVLIEDCDIDCNDDGLCMKSGWGADGFRVNKPTERVVIRNCVVRAAHGGFTIGSDTAGGVRNIEVYGIKMLGDVFHGIRFKEGKCRCGLNENINIHDIEMQGGPVAIYFEPWGFGMPKVPDDAPDYVKAVAAHVPTEKRWGQFRNVNISHVKATGMRKAFYVKGTNTCLGLASCEREPKTNQLPPRQFRFEDVKIQCATAGSIEQVIDWTFVDTQVTATDGSKVAVKDVSGLEGLEQESAPSEARFAAKW